jgi:hypothetical protein
MRVTDDRVLPAAQRAQGPYRAEFLSGIDACLRMPPAQRPQSVADLRSMLVPNALAKETRIVPQPARLIAATRIAATGGGRRRWAIAAAAAVLLLGGSYAGHLFTRWSEESRQQLAAAPKDETDRQARAKAEAQRKADADARDRAEADRKKAEDQERKKQQEVDAKRKAEEEEKNRQAETSRKKAEEERAAQAKAEEEGWSNVKDSSSIPELEAFLNRFPESANAAAARRRIETLKQNEARPKDEVPAQVGDSVTERLRKQILAVKQSKDGTIDTRNYHCFKLNGKVTSSTRFFAISGGNRGGETKGYLEEWA